MLSTPENQDITLSSENDVLPTLEIHKDLEDVSFDWLKAVKHGKVHDI